MLYAAEKSGTGVRSDETSRAIAIKALHKMRAGAMIFYESQYSDEEGIARARFPGKATSSLTPDCCKNKRECPAPTLWKEEPWLSLQFDPPEGANGMRFDYITTGAGMNARYLAIVSIDPECKGRPVYLSCEGHITTNGDVDGNYAPNEGDVPPHLTVFREGK